MTSDFTPGPALVGGLLIGFATGSMLLLQGRIAGVSGVLGRLLVPDAHDRPWRVAFLGGLLAGGALLLGWMPTAFEAVAGSPALPVAAGLLVGVGTSLGNGCTSGHGVCGLGRLSPRSLAATLTFMALGFLTVGLARALAGGAS